MVVGVFEEGVAVVDLLVGAVVAAVGLGAAVLDSEEATLIEQVVVLEECLQVLHKVDQIHQYLDLVPQDNHVLLHVR